MSAHALRFIEIDGKPHLCGCAASSSRRQPCRNSRRCSSCGKTAARPQRAPPPAAILSRRCSPSWSGEASAGAPATVSAVSGALLQKSRNLLIGIPSRKRGFLTDMNPIEMTFAKLKTMLRQAPERTIDGPWRRIGALLDQFSQKECANYFKASGYADSF